MPQRSKDDPRSHTLRSIERLLSSARDVRKDRSKSMLSPDDSSSYTLTDPPTHTDPNTQDSDDRCLRKYAHRNVDESESQDRSITGNLIRGLKLEIPELCAELGTDIDWGLDEYVARKLQAYQNRGTKRVLWELEKLCAVRCMRSGKVQYIRSSQVLPGDVVRLEVGDIAPGDVRIVEHSEDLKVNNSALSPRNYADGSILLAYSGSFVCRGWLRGIVCATGSRTMTAKIGKAANVSEMLPRDTLELRERLYRDYHLVSKDPTQMGAIKKKLHDARASGRYKADFRVPVVASFSSDYLSTLKRQAVLEHQHYSEVIQRNVPKLSLDVVQTICDYVNPHYFFMLEQICSIPPSVILFLPRSEINNFVEYFTNVKSQTRWQVVEPEDLRNHKIASSTPKHFIIPDCPTEVKREVITALYYIGVIYFGGFDVTEESLLAACTLSVCLGRCKICIARSHVVCLGTELERLVYSVFFLRWLNGEIPTRD